MAEKEKEKEKVSTHILSASSTLLGLCFLLLSSIKLLGVGNETLIDELAGTATLFFLASSFFSYGSMRATRRPGFYEKIADGIFVAGLFFLGLVSLVIIFGLVK